MGVEISVAPRRLGDAAIGVREHRRQRSQQARDQRGALGFGQLSGLLFQFLKAGHA